MFETVVEVVAADAVGCADVLVASVTAERRVVAERFAAVATWADLHHPDRTLPESVPAAEQARHRCRAQLGADGTPPVSPSAAVELGMLLGVSTYSAEALLRDVLELRHRSPRVWEAVLTGRLEGWKARQVARATRRLTCEQAQLVDALVLEALVGLPWGRAQHVVQAKVIAADPAAHAARLAQEENRRFVSTRRGSNTAGLRTVVARGHAGDVARLEAMIAHLADLLATAGDPDPADDRRAKAFAMLANPALTCVFLAQTHSTTPPTDPATDPDPDPDPVPEVGSGSPSAVELAVAFGQVLRGLGAKAIDRLRPRSVLYLHLATEAVQGHPGCGVARVEAPADSGPISLDQLQAWLTHDRVVVKPVLDPTGVEPVDGYEIPVHLREAVHLLAPYETFPYGTLPSRSCDLDHSRGYLPIDNGGPPGQTGIHNLGPLGRRHHRAKTFDGFTVHQPAVGVYLWRSPTSHWYQVDHRGTTYLGKHLDQSRTAALHTTQRSPTNHLSRMERHLRDTTTRHLAA